MSDHVPADAVPTGRVDEPAAHAAGRSYRVAGSIKALVLTALFTVMVVSVLVNESDLIFGISMAVMWTAFVWLLWELAERALARRRA